MTPSQFRAGRAILGLARSAIAKKLGVSHETVSNLERADCRPSQATQEAIDAFFEENGIVFFEIPGGALGMIHDPHRTRDALLLARHEEKQRKSLTQV